MIRIKDIDISLFDFKFYDEDYLEITIDVENESDETIYVYFSDIIINDKITLIEQQDYEDYVLELSYEDILPEDNGFPTIDFYNINENLYKSIKKICFKINVEQEDDSTIFFSKKYEIDIDIKKKDYTLKNNEFHEKWADFYKKYGY